MKKLILIACLLLITLPFVQARITDGKVKISLKDQRLIIKVDEGFHLNREAPAKLVDLSSKKEMMPIKKNNDEFIFSLNELKASEIILEYYICDNINTTCEQHKENYSIENNSLTLHAPPVKNFEIIKNSAARKIILNHHHFITDNLEAAKAKAKKDKKLLFVDFSAPWCPACLRLETEVFGKKYFQDKTKNFIKVTLNRDLDNNKESYDKYKVTVIPTMIIINSDGTELSRIIDFRETKDLVIDIEKLVKNTQKTKSYDEYLVLANNGNKEAIKHLAMRAYDMYDHKEALSWFKKLNENSLFSASAEIYVEERDNSKNLLDSYKKYIAKYPESYDSIVWRNELAKSHQAQNTTESTTEAKVLLQENILLINKIIDDKKLQKKIFNETAQGLFTNFESEELYSKLVDTYQLLKEKPSELAAILMLQKKISTHPLSANRTGEVLLAIDYMKTAKMNSEVESWYSKLMEQNPSSDLYPRKLARYYLKEKNYAKALPIAELAVKLSGHYLFWSYVLLAQVQKEMNLKEESIATASKALDLPEAKNASNKEYVDQLKMYLL
ncbi:MAG: thioredoxin domain-containing protein [Bacteriovorax sp.]|nr:thioredoxin domain-containing protein [Bacteriovorax sp.]